MDTDVRNIRFTSKCIVLQTHPPILFHSSIEDVLIKLTPFCFSSCFYHVPTGKNCSNTERVYLRQAWNQRQQDYMALFRGLQPNSVLRVHPYCWRDHSRVNGRPQPSTAMLIRERFQILPTCSSIRIRTNDLN